MLNMQNEEMKSEAVQTEGKRKSYHLLTFAVTVIVMWVLGTYAYIYFYSHLLYNALERTIVQHGIGATTSRGSSSGIPINTLFAMPNLTSPTTLKSNLLVGTNHDTLYAVGWLDLSKGPRVLHVPDFSGRYYAMQFTDPSDGTDFAYVGTRTTGTQAGDYLITGLGWKGQVPSGITQISSPNNSVLVIGRVLVYSDSDLPTVYGLAKLIQLAPLSSK
jgi:hypothetical protein